MSAVLQRLSVGPQTLELQSASQYYSALVWGLRHWSYRVSAVLQRLSVGPQTLELQSVSAVLQGLSVGPQTLELQSECSTAVP